MKHAVQTVGLTSAELAKKCCSIVGQLALWADQRGLEVTTSALFSPELIDRFVVEGFAHLTEGTRRNCRSQLWQVGAAVTGTTLFPPRRVPLKSSDVQRPYSADQVREFVSWSGALPTEAMRRESEILLALGLGVGMKSEEITRAVGTDVRAESGLVVVDVLGTGGRVDRVIPIHHVWADTVARRAEFCGERPLFRPDRMAIRRNDILGFIRRCDVEERPKFTVQRLKITWIVAQLSAGTNLLTLEKASGVAVTQLSKYLQFATAPPDDLARRQLAGMA